MVVSTNPSPPRFTFEDLLSNTIEQLRREATRDQSYFKSRPGIKFEKDVLRIMNEVAVGGPFEGTIKPTSKQAFPDVIAKRFYGVEVKTTNSDNWKSTGNSIMEHSRVNDVENIYILFGKLGGFVDFRFKGYEKCLYDVAITHSPRYLIDMKLNEENTIFSKIEIPYKKLRKLSNPAQPIIQYYKNKLKPGETLWWLDIGQENPLMTNISVKLWTDLTIDQKNKYLAQAFARFPSILGKSNTKYKKFVTWLVARHGIVHPNVRDTFSAGGQETIIIEGKKFNNVPKKIKALENSIPNTINELLNLHPEESLSEYWEDDIDDALLKSNDTRINRWLKHIAKHTDEIISRQLKEDGFDITRMILERF